MNPTVAVNAQTAAAEAALAALTRQFQTMGAAIQRLQGQLNPSRAAIAATGQTAQVSGGKLDRFGAAMDKANRQSKGLTLSLNNLRTAAAAAVGGLGIGAYVSLADSYTNINNKLRLVTTGEENLNAVRRESLAVANRTRMGFEDTVDLYSKLSSSTKSLGLSQTDVMGVTETFSKALQVGGATAQEASASIRQFGQAMASGALKGDEFTALNENAQGFMQALERGLGKTRGELKKMATEGKLSSAVIIEALKGQAGEVTRQFETMTPTIASAFIVLKNNLTNILGGMNSTTGAAGGLAQAILFLASNLDTAAIAAAGLGVALVAMNSGKIVAGIRATRTAVLALNVAMAANPIGAVFAIGALAVTGLVLAFEKLFPKIKVTSDGVVNLRDFFIAAFQLIGEQVAKVGAFFSDLWNGTFADVRKWCGETFGDIMKWMQEAGQFAGRVAAALIDHWVGSFRAIVEVFNNFPAILADVAITAVNGLIGIIEQGVNRIASAITNGPLAPFLDGKGGGQISLGRVANPFAGSAGRVNTAYQSGQGSAQGAAEATMGAVRGAVGAVTDRARSNIRNRPAGSGVSDTRGTPSPTAPAGDGKGGGRDSAASAAEKQADALNELERAIEQVGLADREAAVISALGTAGLVDRARIVDGLVTVEGEQANLIAATARRLFDAEKRHEDMTAAVEQLAEARRGLRTTELDLMAVEQSGRAEAIRSREVARLAYEQTLKDIEARTLDNDTRREQLRLANQQYAAELRLIKAREDQGKKDFKQGLDESLADARLENRALTDPEGVERDRQFLQAERDRQARLLELSKVVGLTAEEIKTYKDEIDALYDQQIINIEQDEKLTKARALFQETNDLVTDIFERGEIAMAEFFIKLIANQLKALAYSKLMGTSMQEAFSVTGGGGGFGGGGGGWGGLIGNIFSSMMGGGKAGGGFLDGNKMYPVGQSEGRKTELLFPGKNSYLMSNSQLQRSMGQNAKGGNALSVTVNLPANYQGNPHEVAAITRVNTQRLMQKQWK